MASCDVLFDQVDAVIALPDGLAHVLGLDDA